MARHGYYGQLGFVGMLSPMAVAAKWRPAGRVHWPRLPGAPYYRVLVSVQGGSVAEWLACWTQAQKGPVQIAVATLSGNSLRQTVYIHCASLHQAAKSVSALLRVAGVTAGLAESNGSLPPGL